MAPSDPNSSPCVAEEQAESTLNAPWEVEEPHTLLILLPGYLGITVLNVLPEGRGVRSKWVFVEMEIHPVLLCRSLCSCV